MNQKDRDNYFATMVMWNMLEEWRTDPQSEINDKDRHKVSTIQKMIIELLVQYGKREGKENLSALTDESQKYKFAILKKEEEMELSGTFEMDIVKSIIQRVIDKNIFYCFACDKKDFKNCEWFALKNLVDGAQHFDCGECPYKGQII